MKNYNELLNIASGTHLRLTPIPKFPNLDRNVIVNYIDDFYGEPAIVYGITDSCDGYAIPFSWIKSYKVVEA